jgi:hypothetical protein
MLGGVGVGLYEEARSIHAFRDRVRWQFPCKLRFV